MPYQSGLPHTGRIEDCHVYYFVVIPAKTGIQEGDDRMVNRLQNSPACAEENNPQITQITQSYSPCLLQAGLARVDSGFFYQAVCCRFSTRSI